MPFPVCGRPCCPPTPLTLRRPPIDDGALPLLQLDSTRKARSWPCQLVPSKMTCSLPRAGRDLPSMVDYLASLNPPVVVTREQLGHWFNGRHAPQPSVLARLLAAVESDLAEVLPDGTRVTLEVLRW